MAQILIEKTTGVIYASSSEDVWSAEDAGDLFTLVQTDAPVAFGSDKVWNAGAKTADAADLASTSAYETWKNNNKDDLT